MELSKQEWLLEHLRCPLCRWPQRLRAQPQDLECPGCRSRFGRAGHRFDMLPVSLREQCNLTHTDKVSDHSYDQRTLDLIERARERGGMVLDCGAGARTTVFPNLVQVEVVPFDNADVLAANQALPFADAAFDVVLSLDVLEHVNNPFRAAQEMARVLKPDGLLYVDAPFMQTEHGYPEHYFNMTRMGLRALFGTDMLFEEHWVPNSGHPIYALCAVLRSYYAGLPKNLRASFEEMKFGDFIRSQPKEWYRHPIFREFLAEKKWTLASTTRAVVRKITPPSD